MHSEKSHLYVYRPAFSLFAFFPCCCRLWWWWETNLMIGTAAELFFQERICRWPRLQNTIFFETNRLARVPQVDRRFRYSRDHRESLNIIHQDGENQCSTTAILFTTWNTSHSSSPVLHLMYSDTTRFLRRLTFLQHFSQQLCVFFCCCPFFLLL